MEKTIPHADQRAKDLFGNGFHCAEAVTFAALESLGEDAGPAAAHATAFGGGFGKSFEEACGALSGSLIVIGHFCGRKTPGPDWDLPASLGDELRRQFIHTWKTTHCKTLRERFGEEEQMAQCREVVGAATRDLIELMASAGIIDSGTI